MHRTDRLGLPRLIPVRLDPSRSEPALSRCIRRPDSRRARPRLCRDAARRRFDLVAAWSVDRLGRSLQDLVGFLDELHAIKIDLYLHQQGIDTTTPAGRAMFQMCGVFAEFERAMVQERVNAGLARARAKGTRLGRPPLSAKTQEAVRAARNDGKSIRAIAAELELGIGTVHQILTL